MEVAVAVNEQQANGAAIPPPFGTAMIKNLPTDIMVRISLFIELPCRIRLASASKTLQELIFQECIPLWREINVSDLPYTQRRSLTDPMLMSLLIRVNAKSVTRAINLRGTSLRGTSLEPLRGSEVLETLDMTGGYPRRIELDTVLPILRTMIPLKLFHVRLHEYGLVGEPQVLVTFLRDLQDARLASARDASIPCFGCQGSVVQEEIQLVTNIGGRSLQCGACRHHFCRRASCETDTVDCNWCGILSCETCIVRCPCCGINRCEECQHQGPCCSKGDERPSKKARTMP